MLNNIEKTDLFYNYYAQWDYGLQGGSDKKGHNGQVSVDSILD